MFIKWKFKTNSYKKIIPNHSNLVTPVHSLMGSGHAPHCCQRWSPRLFTISAFWRHDEPTPQQNHVLSNCVGRLPLVVKQSNIALSLLFVLFMSCQGGREKWLEVGSPWDLSCVWGTWQKCVGLWTFFNPNQLYYIQQLIAGVYWHFEVKKILS